MNLIIERGEDGGFCASFDSEKCTEWGEGPTPEAALADLLATLCEEKYGGHNENGAFAGRSWWHSADEVNVVSKKERIVELERKVKELEERLAAVEARGTYWYPIWPWPPPWENPYEITWTDGTALKPPMGQVWCPSACIHDNTPIGTTTAGSSGSGA